MKRPLNMKFKWAVGAFLVISVTLKLLWKLGRDAKLGESGHK